MRMMASVVALCALSGTLAAQGPAAAVPSADDRAVRDVVQRYVDGREARDAKAVAALFTPDADQLVSSGEWSSMMTTSTFEWVWPRIESTQFDR